MGVAWQLRFFFKPSEDNLLFSKYQGIRPKLSLELSVPFPLDLSLEDVPELGIYLLPDLHERGRFVLAPLCVCLRVQLGQDDLGSHSICIQVLNL
jgi:hypothetical protein